MNEYLRGRINFGGVIVTRAEAIATMRAEGMDQRLIDRWMQGADLAARRK